MQYIAVQYNRLFMFPISTVRHAPHRAVVLMALLIPSWSDAQTAGPPAALEATIAAAESSLREGEWQIAESRYRSALMQGWMVMGTLRVAEHRLPDARDAFRRASMSAVEAKDALQSLALVHLEMGEPGEAVTILNRLAGTNPTDVPVRRLLAQALVASGQAEQAVEELEEASAAAPDDLELTFLLASGYLRLKKVDRADQLFARILKARPLPQTHVLIGRTYRDAGEYERARTALQTALKLDPRTRRAHYYLGTLAVMAEGVLRLNEAIGEFQQELKLAPTDPLTNLRLGMALVEAHRENAALPPLEVAAHSTSPPPEALHYLGRCLLALDRPSDAVAAFRRALELSHTPTVDEARLRNIHYQLGLALRKLGATEEAAAHFAEAERASTRRAAKERVELGRYLTDAPERKETALLAPAIESSPFSDLTSEQRTELERRTKIALARAYLNVGVMQAQNQRFSRAAEFFEGAVAVDPDFPQAQYSLGVAYFNAQQYQNATAPLAHALAADPGNGDLRRMLALAWLNIEVYDKAAHLLREDTGREADPQLQYAYALALVRSNRAAEAEAVFSRLLAQHGNTPELTVLLGQAHAQQGDYARAVESLQKARQLKPDVPDANATLGFIYLKQGRLPEAEQALRAELAAHADNVKARHTLAAVLDLDGRPDQALPLLRAVLKVRPGFADARYLLGKILLAQGTLPEALEHLEAAARIAPDEANIHYQLGQAYQKLGRTEDAQKQFEIFRQLKDKRRGSTP